MELQTSRLKLRRFHSGDLNNMIELESDPLVMKFTPLRVSLTTEQSAERLKNTVDKNLEREPIGVWAIEEKQNGSFVGWIMLMQTGLELPEIGYMVVQRQWGRGFATEAVARVIEYGFDELKYPGFMATIDADNEVSRKVLEKLDFKLYKKVLLPHKVLQKETPAELLRLLN